MTFETRRTTNQYAGEYGFFIGILWTAMFLCYSEGISHGNMLLMAACLIPALLSIVVPPMLSLRINQKLHSIGEHFTYWRGYIFSLTMFTFASILSGVATYAYLTFINKGALIDRLSSMLQDPNVAGAYKQMGLGGQYEELMTAVSILTPQDISLSLFSNGIMIGIIASLLLALFASFDLRRLNNGSAM